MRVVAVLALCVMVGGCGLTARHERQEQMAAAKVTIAQGFADCKTQYPEGSKQYVAKNKCDALAAQTIKPYVTWPDLFDKDWAARAVIAERLQAGKMTLAEANQEAAQTHSQIAAEEQQRNLASRSVAAQEAVAVAESSPTICNRVGTTTICN